ncbi:MAG: hypothetical protein M1832_002389 [Thelocarpon impressellum]|nr:MAG: hypothetical protein M1832_002389 [Thelocarpon impressellum]
MPLLGPTHLATLLRLSNHFLKLQRADVAARLYRFHYSKGLDLVRTFRKLSDESIAQSLALFVDGFDMDYSPDWKRRRTDQLSFVGFYPGLLPDPAELEPNGRSTRMSRVFELCTDLCASDRWPMCWALVTEHLPWREGFYLVALMTRHDETRVFHAFSMALMRAESDARAAELNDPYVVQLQNAVQFMRERAWRDLPDAVSEVSLSARVESSRNTR